jgi:hypothetical protein
MRKLIVQQSINPQISQITQMTGEELKTVWSVVSSVVQREWIQFVALT